MHGTSVEKITEFLNSFFVESIASLKKDNVEECDHSKLRNFISSRLVSGASYRIPLISEMEVSNLFKSIASNKATDHDGPNPRILKECSSHLYSPLYKMNLTSKKLENFHSALICHAPFLTRKDTPKSDGHLHSKYMIGVL